MKKIALTIACSMALASSLVLGGSPPAATAADDAETLAVDFSQTTGDFRGGASGTLYGFGDDGVPSQALVNGAHITNTSQKAPHGTQHPSGDALKIEDGFFAKHGSELDIYIQDYYPDWSYNGGQRPGDTRSYDQADGTFTEVSNGVWDYLEVVEFVTEAVATQSAYPEQYVFIPFNEPDGGNWYSDWDFFNSTFLPDWKATYDKIQEVYARHGLDTAVIGGPGDSRWHADRSSVYLEYAKATETLPQYFIWHELGIDNLRDYRGHYEEYRAMEKELGIDPLEVNITEYGLLRDMAVPGQLIQWFSMFEDTKVDAQTAYWNYAGNFSDNSARTNGANAGWWMFKWYGDLEGSQTAQVTPPQLNVVDTLQGIGAVDTDAARATVLYGGSSASSVNLQLAGIDSATFGETVDIEVREAPLSGAEGLAANPRVVTAIESAPVVDGELAIDVPNYDRYAGYQVIVTPHQARAVTTDPVFSTSIEAENTQISNATVYDQDPKGNGGWIFLASGSRDVGSFNNAGARAEWTVDVPRDGSYRFQVIGATPGTPGRHALFVDDAQSGLVQYTADLALNDNSRWKYRGSAETIVELTAGTHTLSLRASEDGTTVLPNSDITLDKFTLTDVTDGEPTSYPASASRLSGDAGMDYSTVGQAGSAQLQGDGRMDVYATAFDSGYYDVSVRYTSEAATSLDLAVNGRSLAQLSAEAGGSWTSTARVNLSQGINEFEVSSPDGARVSEIVTTRVVSADEAAVKIEAESGTLGGAANVTTVDDSTGSNASGLAYVDGLGDGADNAVNLGRPEGTEQPGQYDITVAYSNAELGGKHDYNPQVVDRRLEVSEDGVGLAGQAMFRYTYAWDSFWLRTVPVELTSESGAIVLGSESGFAPNVDYVVVAPALLGEPTTVETQVPDPTDIVVTPAEVTHVDEDGTENDTYTIPASDGVEYLVGEEVVPAGTYPGAGSVTVTARALSGYVFAEGAVAEWIIEFSAEDSGEPATPGTPGTTDPGTVTPAPGSGGGGNGDLASTGVDVSLGALALLALLAGGVLIFRRRKTVS